MARLPRIYHPEATAPGLLLLRGPSAHRLSRVLRLRPGNELLVFAGDGNEWRAEVRGVSERAVEVEVIELTRTVPVTNVLEVRLALLRPQRFEWAVEKVTEAGADIIGGLLTERTEERFRLGPARLERWQRIAVEAAEQCGRLSVPAVAEPVRLRDLLARAPHGLLLADPAGAPILSLRDRLSAFRRLTVLVGPEGGFSETERAAAEAAGALTASLGETVLRAETAAIVATAFLRSVWA